MLQLNTQESEVMFMFIPYSNDGFGHGLVISWFL